MTFTITFIRHGESTANVRNIWAGWLDSPLTNHGMNQAKALGAYLSNTPLTAIYASPLLRAFSTAQAVLEAQPDPKPPLSTSLLLREQNWGIGEGHPWSLEQIPGLSLEEHYARGVFPVLHDKSQKFPGGESLDDLGQRAAQAIEEVIMPHIWKAVREGLQGVHLAVVSHGLCISELIPALLKKDASGIPSKDYRGLNNTAWTRITIDVKGAREGQTIEFSDSDPPPLVVKLTDHNRHEHLDNVRRQKGGIGSSAFDPKQQDIRAFFGGGIVGEKNEEGRSESNARDEVDVEIN